MRCLLKWRGFRTKRHQQAKTLSRKRIGVWKGCVFVICWNSGTVNLFRSATYFRTFLNTKGNWTQRNCHTQDIVSGAGMLLIGVKRMCEAPFLRLTSAKCREPTRLYSEQCLAILVTRCIWKENNWIPPTRSGVRGSNPSATFLNIKNLKKKPKHCNSCVRNTPFAPPTTVISWTQKYAWRLFLGSTINQRNSSLKWSS